MHNPSIVDCVVTKLVLKANNLKAWVCFCLVLFLNLNLTKCQVFNAKQYNAAMVFDPFRMTNKFADDIFIYSCIVIMHVIVR